jgi:hypothetical protein
MLHLLKPEIKRASKGKTLQAIYNWMRIDLKKVCKIILPV